MRGHPILRIDLGLTAALLGAAILLWTSPSIIYVPLAFAIALAACDLITKRIPLLATIACLGLILASAVSFHAMGTAIVASAMTASLPIARLLPSAPLRKVSLADLAATSLAGAIATTSIFFCAIAATAATFLAVRLIVRKPTRIPLAATLLGTSTACMLLTGTAIYR